MTTIEMNGGAPGDRAQQSLGGASEAPGGVHAHRLTFTGEAGAYFWICLRTFLLAVITLGIYDAWGTVERQKYRVGHTRIDGHGFGYHANPITILIGRLVAFGALIVIQIAFAVLAPVAPFMPFVLAVALLFLAPWFIIRALQFHLRNTSYRNVRFDFLGGYWKSFQVHILLPIVSIISLGFAYPWVRMQMARYKLDNMRFGTSGFETQSRLGPLYATFFAIAGAVVLLGILVYAIFSVSMFASVLSAQDLEALENDPERFANLALILYVPLIVLYLIARAVFHGVFLNCLLNDMRLGGGHRVVSEIPVPRFVWVSISNALATALSLGLAYPWSVMRKMRTIAGGLTLHANGDLDRFVAHQNMAGGAVGMEMGALDGVAEGVFTGAI